MSAYSIEIGWAVDSQIDSLIEVLHENKNISNYPIITRSAITSAPHDDSLFDSLVLFVKIETGGTTYLRGTITKWSPIDGDTYYHYEIKSFQSVGELILWFEETDNARNFCKQIMLGRANLVRDRYQSLIF